LSTDSLRSDIKAAIRRIEKSPLIDVSQELRLNVYPLLESIVRELDEQATALEEVAEAVDFEGSYIEQDLGVAILTAFGVGAAMAAELSKIVEVASDDILKARLSGIIADWVKISEAVAKDVHEAMPSEEDEEDESEESEAEGEEE